MPKDTLQNDIQVSGLSIVIPTYNGAEWLPRTIDEIAIAINEAGLKKFEIVVINDGSTDDTVETVEKYAKSSPLPIRTVSQENSGRFIARKTGTETAKYPYLLFVDTRVFIGSGSLKYLLGEFSKDQSRQVWCSHARVAKEGNIYARFWEAMAFLAWRKYFSNPKDTSYGINEFDDYPKGTTCFFVKKSILVEANEWFMQNTKDLKVSNDDTLLLRGIAKKHNINISPGFWCTYHARSTLGKFVPHVYHRGKVVVDGFLRNDGNKLFIPLLVIMALPIVVLGLVLIWPAIIVPLVTLGLVLWSLALPLILLMGVPFKDGFSLFILLPIFTIYYIAGMWNAVVKIYLPVLMGKNR